MTDYDFNPCEWCSWPSEYGPRCEQCERNLQEAAKQAAQYIDEMISAEMGRQ